MDLHPYIARLRARFAEVETALSEPGVFQQGQRAQELTREYARLKESVQCGEAYLKALRELDENRALAAAEDDPELAQMAQDEVSRLGPGESQDVHIPD